MPRIVILLLSFVVIFGGEVAAQADRGKPNNARDYYERGLKRESAKRYEDALADYRTAGELNPKFFDAHFSRSSLFAELHDYRNAVEALTASLKARPKSYSALFNRGLYRQHLREYDNAIKDYTRALAIDADFSHIGLSLEECRAHAHHYRGRVYQWFKKDDTKAIADYTAALRLDPKTEMVRYRRAKAYHNIKAFAKAHEDFQQAIKEDPNYPNLLTAYAWQLATCPDAEYRNGSLAVEFATKTKHLDTLAAAYAETGRFGEAVVTQRRAIEQLDGQKKSKSTKTAEQRNRQKKEMQLRLTSYRAGRPHRDE